VSKKLIKYNKCIDVYEDLVKSSFKQKVVEKVNDLYEQLPDDKTIIHVDVGVWYVAERLETDEEYETRLKKEKKQEGRELKELARLKAKYEEN